MNFHFFSSFFRFAFYFDRRRLRRCFFLFFFFFYFKNCCVLYIRASCMVWIHHAFFVYTCTLHHIIKMLKHIYSFDMFFSIFCFSYWFERFFFLSVCFSVLLLYDIHLFCFFVIFILCRSLLRFTQISYIKI